MNFNHPKKNINKLLPRLSLGIPNPEAKPRHPSVSFFLILLVVLSTFNFQLSIVHAATAGGALQKPPNNLGLVGYWPFNEGAGSIAGDFSGNGNNGTLVNSPTWVSGRHGKALNFKLASSQYTVTASFTPPSGNMTISAWYKPESVTSNGINGNFILGFRNVDVNDSFYLVQLANSANIEARFRNSAGTAATITLSGKLTAGQWTHLTLVYNGSNLTPYVNGVAQTPSGASGAFSGTNWPFYIGGYLYPSFPQYTNGLIDDARLYNRALSASEVAQLYGSGQVTYKPPTSTGLVGYWSMDDATGTLVSDLSGGNTPLTFGGSPSWVSGKHGKAVSFNGSTDYADVASHAQTPVTAPPVTICAWFYPTSAVNGVIVGTGEWTGGTIGFELTARSNQAIRALSNSGAIAESTTLYTLNAWNHGCAVFNTDSSRTIYINGGNPVTNNTTSSGYTVQTTYIGARANNGTHSNFFAGRVDDVRIYNRALSATEVASLYASGQVTWNASQNSKMTNGLVGLWSMNGQDIIWGSNFMRDGSGNGNNGTLNSFSMTKSLDFGVNGQALRFDGSATEVDTTTQFSNPQTFTVATWFKTTVASGHKLIGFESNQSGTGSASFDRMLYMGTDGKVYFGWYTGSNTTVASGATLNDGVWHLAVGTHDGATGTLYIDGISQGSNSGAPQLYSGYWRLGGYKLASWTNASDGFFNGSLDEARVYNRVLSSAEVRQLYNMGKQQ